MRDNKRFSYIILAPMLTARILEEPTIRHYIPPNKPQIRINFYKLTQDGVNIQPRSIEVINKEHAEVNIKALATRDLLSKPIAQLIEEAKAKLAEASKEKAKVDSLDEAKSIEAMEDINDIRPELWVDKYNPKHFIELVTDERVNRELLTWMKSWDKIVFPNKRKVQKVFFEKPSYPVLQYITL